MSKLPTAEESINKSGVFIEDFISSSTYSACISAIESHTTTHTAELRERIKELEKKLSESEETNFHLAAHQCSKWRPTEYGDWFCKLEVDNQRYRRALERIADLIGYMTKELKEE